MKQLTINNKEYIVLNNKTKKAIKLLNKYENSNEYTIFDAYGNPSREKERIEKEIETFIENFNHPNNKLNMLGCMRDYKIISHCIFNFVCGYKYHNGDKQKSYLCVETGKNNYIIEL